MLEVARSKMYERTTYNTITAQDVYTNTCAATKYGIHSPESRWAMLQRMLQNVSTKVLWDFYIPTAKQILTKLTGLCGNEEGTEKQLVTDVQVPRESGIKGKEYEMMKKLQGWKDSQEKMWQM